FASPRRALVEPGGWTVREGPGRASRARRTLYTMHSISGQSERNPAARCGEKEGTMPTETAIKLEVVDADGHYVEPPQAMPEYIEAKYRDVAPRRVVGPDG